MTLTLDREIEQLATAQAARRGVPVEKYLSDLVQRDANNGNGAQSTLNELYAQSLANSGELTALTTAPGDIYEYSAEDLAAMESGEFERPLR
jgi:hypothetical protein